MSNWPDKVPVLVPARSSCIVLILIPVLFWICTFRARSSPFAPNSKDEAFRALMSDEGPKAPLSVKLILPALITVVPE